ncbi:SafA/ExsA family spore coat assembly protein [Bacillus changyiensis]|uniref:SafA/ExsA family spore coat assembly protein n=1 Tax=Bacillus changyiensis TaxID=3004103 RepID=UPI0022E17FE9|nr:SafA/ExsA family spore coat assembly protein [Bacillus changyiensis]MDA1477426.1 SafA/ExsA family spore coat assembly protein [Bacillus changyiensis]
MKIHIVQKGDTLENIAQKYEVDFKELKSLNSQLSNPDLIMPGMKIKVPSEAVPVKKEEQVNMRKEFPKPPQHPFADEKPISTVDIEDTKPKEKPSVPYVPPVPKLGGNDLPEGDISGVYQNVSQLHQSSVPPRPYEPQQQSSIMNDQWRNEEENNMENVNYPNMSQQPQGGMESQMPSGMPSYPTGYYPQPYPFYPGCWIPVSPILPGSGLAYPWYPYPAQMPYMPQAGYMNPGGFQRDDNLDYENDSRQTYYQQPFTAPGYMGQYPYPPYQGQYPTYPGFTPQGSGYTGNPNDPDCGCGGPSQFQGGYPGGVPYGQMPQMGAPYMGGYTQQPQTSQMFNRPEEDED